MRVRLRPLRSFNRTADPRDVVTFEFPFLVPQGNHLRALTMNSAPHPACPQARLIAAPRKTETYTLVYDRPSQKILWPG